MVRKVHCPRDRPPPVFLNTHFDHQVEGIRVKMADLLLLRLLELAPQRCRKGSPS